MIKEIYNGILLHLYPEKRKFIEKLQEALDLNTDLKAFFKSRVQKKDDYLDEIYSYYKAGGNIEDKIRYDFEKSIS